MALLIVPAIQAAERNSLNSKPSFDTSVTYSLIFSLLIVLDVAFTNSYYAVDSGTSSEAEMKFFRQASGPEHESAPSRAISYVIVQTPSSQTSSNRLRRSSIVSHSRHKSSLSHLFQLFLVWSLVKQEMAWTCLFQQ